MLTLTAGDPESESAGRGAPYGSALSRTTLWRRLPFVFAREETDMLAYRADCAAEIRRQAPDKCDSGAGASQYGAGALMQFALACAASASGRGDARGGASGGSLSDGGPGGDGGSGGPHTAGSSTAIRSGRGSGDRSGSAGSGGSRDVNARLRLKKIRMSGVRSAVDELVAALRQSLQAGKPVGFLLRHGYTMGALNHSQARRRTNSPAAALAGADAALWAALRAPNANLNGAAVHLRPVLFHRSERLLASSSSRNSRFRRSSGREPTPEWELESAVYSCTHRDVRALLEGRPAPQAQLTVTMPTSRSLARQAEADSEAQSDHDDARTDAGPRCGRRRRLWSGRGRAAAASLKLPVDLRDISFLLPPGASVAQSPADWNRDAVQPSQRPGVRLTMRAEPGLASEYDSSEQLEEEVVEQTYFMGAIIVVPRAALAVAGTPAKAARSPR